MIGIVVGTTVTTLVLGDNVVGDSVKATEGVVVGITLVGDVLGTIVVMVGELAIGV